MAGTDLPPAGLIAVSDGALVDPSNQAEVGLSAEQADTSLALNEDCESAGDTDSPHVALTGFSGSLDMLLGLARAERIDLASLSFADLLDQLLAAMDRPGPLVTKAGWVVVMANIVALRSRLLLPADNPERREAAEAAGRLRDRLAALQDVRKLAAWLEARPQLGRDVFGRGAPEWLGMAVEEPKQFDAIEFLWAAVGVFDDEVVETEVVYRLIGLGVFLVREAQDRIRRLLADLPDGCELGQLLPAVENDSGPMNTLLRRSAWTSTFTAVLELTKRTDVVLDQDGAFEPICVRFPV